MELIELFSGFQFGFRLISIMVMFAFIFTLLVFVVVFSRVISERKKGSRAPRLSVNAKILEKRMRYSRNINSMRSAAYYVTFEVEGGDRVALNVSERDFYLLIEGDQGVLTFQENRFHSFERKYK